VSLSGSPGAEETRQASLFVDVYKRSGGGARFWRGTASAPELHSLLARFLGSQGADETFRDYAQARGLRWPHEELPADAEFVHFAETQLAGAIGAASARIMVASVVEEEALTLDEVRKILDEASQVIMYSHQLEQKSRELEAATTELRAANERLKELDRLKDDFLSTVTHELRTPLTSIRAFTEILNQDPEIDLAQRRKFLGIVTKETERLTRLINQVLDLAKIESGRAEWHETRVDMREVISDTVTAMEQVFQEKGIQVVTRIPERVSPVLADLDRMIQVMLNLLSNAVKFCDQEQGRIEVALSERDGWLRVDVHDNGPGVLPQDQHIIFDKFRQAGDTLTEKPHGTGLGLPISRHIIEHHGGQIWVESAPGHGACFSFRLPIVKQAEVVNA
jgi:signal transduction histidine kinase